jgi:hypothetical protein
MVKAPTPRLFLRYALTIDVVGTSMVRRKRGAGVASV